jgi:hypothetical protein
LFSLLGRPRPANFAKRIIRELSWYQRLFQGIRAAFHVPEATYQFYRLCQAIDFGAADISNFEISSTWSVGFKRTTAEAGVTLIQNGTSSQPRFYLAFPGEKPGFFIVDGGVNHILNCDLHHNWDTYFYAGTTPAPGENADGFGFHSRNPADTGTVFRGCRSWWNADDGWDFINSYAPALVEDSWA